MARPLADQARRLRRELRRVRRDGWRRLVKVCSHPRSGTHLMEAFLAENFYPGRDLEVRPVRWGHWSDPQLDADGNPFGKLFGGHRLPNPQAIRTAPVVYVFRDGRAVAHSIWRTPHFLSAATKRDLTFSEFLQAPLDWFCAPDVRATEQLTIAEHWHRHVDAWVTFAKGHDNVMVVRFEELLAAPAGVHERVRARFFPDAGGGRISTIDRPVGILPNEGRVDGWRDAFTAADEEAFLARLPDRRYLWP